LWTPKSNQNQFSKRDLSPQISADENVDQTLNHKGHKGHGEKTKAKKLFAPGTNLIVSNADGERKSGDRGLTKG
jgi:hypothetical protein